jgi:4-amino-4-deoxy-L-arabinose transferase-like glycosyltransferase
VNQSQQKGIGKAVGGGLILTVLAALLYSLTLSRHYTADSLLYALLIEGDDLQALIDPTHLLLHPLALLWYRIWQALGWAGRSLMPIQLLNALAGAACVGLMWALAHTLSRSSRSATIVAIGFAVSGGLWLLSVEAEFITIPLALQLLALWLILAVLADGAGRANYAVLLGIVVAIAILSYLTSVFLVLMVLLGFITASIPAGTKWRQIALFLATLLLLLIPPFTLALATWTRGDLSQLYQLGGQGAYGLWHWVNVPHGFYTFLRSIGLFPGLAMNDSTRDLLAAAGNEKRLIFFAYYALIAAFAVMPLLCLVLRHRELWASAKQTILVLLTWTITFTAFAFYWVAGDVTFWVPVLASWWLLIAICWPTGGAARWWNGVLLAILLLGIINGTQLILPRTNLESNQPYLTAKRIAAETGAEDIILIEPDDITTLTVTYFAERRVLPVQQSVFKISDLPEWIATEAKNGKKKGGRLLILDADGKLREIE